MKTNETPKKINEIPNIAEPLYSWYLKNRRTLPWREDPTPYHVWVSEIMLQQTRVETVLPYYQRFLEALPDVRALSLCPEEKLLKLWEGLGYYSRVRNMKKCAVTICEQYDGEFPSEPCALMKLSGIGTYTAGAIASIAFGKKVSAIDGNALRVFARLRMDDRDIAKEKTKREVGKEWTGILEATARPPGELNQALMDLGSMICIPKDSPDCLHCPIKEVCLAQKEDRMFDFPYKSADKPRKIEYHTILLIRDGDTYALRKRPPKGLLAGMFEFPGFSGDLSEREVLEILQKKNLMPLQIKKIAPARHIFSHIEWRMTGYEIRIAAEGRERSEEWIFAPRKSIQNRYPIPSAYAAFLKEIHISRKKDSPNRKNNSGASEREQGTEITK